MPNLKPDEQLLKPKGEVWRPKYARCAPCAPLEPQIRCLKSLQMTLSRNNSRGFYWFACSRPTTNSPLSHEVCGDTVIALMETLRNPTRISAKKDY
jgi:hypothetical protein